MKPKDQLESALSLRDSGDISGSISALERLIESFPESDFAESARAHLFNMRSGLVNVHELPANVSKIILTTAPTVAGWNVATTLDIVAAECVLGMNVFADIAASFADVLGGRSDVWQDSLRRARVTCLNELRREAAALRADAVISISLGYSQISGKGSQMLFLVASGTAVRLSGHESRPV